MSELSSYSSIELEAFRKGWQSWDASIGATSKPKNPYTEDSDLWRAWNKGWNLNTSGIDSFDWCNSCGGRNCIC